MPLPETTPAERRLTLVTRFDGWAHLVMAALIALSPLHAFRLFALGAAADAHGAALRLFAALAAAGSLALGLLCLQVAREPRQLRPAYLPALASHLLCAVLCLSWWLRAPAAAGPARALLGTGVAALALCGVGLWAFRGASPGVNLGPSLAPPVEPAQQPIQLGTRKAASDA